MTWSPPLPRARLLLAGAAAAVFWAVYARALPYPPVFDDFAHVIGNRAIRYLFHPRIFLESEAARSRPLPYVTFAISYWLGGMSLSGLRVVSLLLHAVNSVFVAAFFQRWLAREREGLSRGAVAAGAAFLLHPLAADSVIYLSARGTLLVLFFLLSALLFHARLRQTVLTWLGYLACGLLAFLSRESAAALAPIIVVVHRLSGRSRSELAPYLGPLVLGGLVGLVLKASYLSAAWWGFFAIQGDVDVRSLGDYLRLSLSIWPQLLRLFVDPTALSIDHGLSLPSSWLDPLVLGGALAWAVFPVALYRFWKGGRAWFPVCWLFLALIPTNSIFPVLDPLSERHLYFALPAIAWAFGMAADTIPARRSWLAALVCALPLLAGGTVTLARVLDWRDNATTWSVADRVAPGKFRVSYNLASALLSERGDREGALRALGTTLAAIGPGGIRYEEQDQGLEILVSALLALGQERGLRPAQLWDSLGIPRSFWAELVILRAELETLPEPAWQKAWAEALARVGSVPASPRAHEGDWVKESFRLLHARAQRRFGHRREAIAEYEAVFRPFSDRHFPYWPAREELADLYVEEGRVDEAIFQYELAAYQYKVFKRFPVSLQKKLYTLFKDRGDLYRATDAIGELVRVYTDDPELRRLYADLLRAREDRHAARQSSEARFYSDHSVKPTDEKEFLRP